MNPRLLLFFLFPCVLSAQSPQNETAQIVAVNPIDELPSLRRKHVYEGLDTPDLFRLAGLYLVSGITAKSAELYAELIQKLEKSPPEIAKDERQTYLARSHYNRGLALFSLGLYESAEVNFERAFYYDKTNIEALRMLGSIAFTQKNKDKVKENWTAYLASAPEGLVKQAVQDALTKILSPDFSFDSKEDKTPANPTWPFLNHETIPYPDALYEKKRVI